MLSIAFVYNWIWLQVIFGITVFIFFIVRSLTDERKTAYREEAEK
ncbi:hypothetical protein [Halobacillus amylolyticus]|nr:hypothetical protein [Halobacillus amylolyticus]